jgi:hypothetical protein
MTIKVYMNDGRIEEYPNAYAYWEWDESEKGTDSAYRICSMDKNFSSAIAYVHPEDCKKIEITSEESDKIFKSPPSAETIGIKQYKIFKAIDEERERQYKKWGEQNHVMLRCEKPGAIKEGLEYFRLINDKTQLYDWYSIIQEEVYEAFSETAPEKQREEMEQVAAVVVQIIECLDRKLEARKNEKGD